MGKIALLSNDLASQIAAGEVVERPASALKELLENAVDASATRCSIEIEGGGITRLSVLDDGHGMTEEDARLSFQRHATSKLRQVSDLESLSSYGFRGEALPSIASVSRFTLRTRTADQSAGTELFLEGSLNARVRPIGCAVGTLVEVRDLFFNIPARRKFLRSSSTESGHLTDTVEALALARPDLAITLRRDGRQVRQWHRASNRQERVRKSFDDPLIRCAGQRGPLTVEAFLSRPERARNGAGGLKIMVNDRPIKDRALAVAAAQAYGQALERGRYPRGVIYLDLPPALVDFNVHPQKLELRFAEPRAVSDALYRVLASQLPSALNIPTPTRGNYGARAAAAASEVAPTVASEVASEVAPTGASEVAAAAPQPSELPTQRLRRWEVQDRPRTETVNARPLSPLPLTPLAISPLPLSPVAPTQPATTLSSEAPPWTPAAAPPTTSSSSSTVDEIPWTELRYMGQAQQRYLICEGSRGLYVLEQHAASERVVLARMLHQLKNGVLTSQSLLFPVNVELTPPERKLLEDQAEVFADLGLSIQIRSDQQVSLHSVPQLLQRISPPRLLGHVLGVLMAEESSDKISNEHSGAKKTLGSLACHASLRAGETIAHSEGSALLHELASVDFGESCPHGTPLLSFRAWPEFHS